MIMASAATRVAPQWWWNRSMDDICAQRQSTSKLREILNRLLYDGEDMTRADLLGTGGAGSTLLTPIERLLLFVRFAFSRLDNEFEIFQSIGHYCLDAHREHFRRL